jgi:hypothetical protein
VGGEGEISPQLTANPAAAKQRPKK